MNWFDAEQQVLRQQDEAHRQSRTVDWSPPERPSSWSRLTAFFSRRRRPRAAEAPQAPERLALPGGHDHPR